MTSDAQEKLRIGERFVKICRLKKMCAVEHAQDDAYGTEVG